MKPSYPLKKIKELLKANHCQFNENALLDGSDDFMWGPDMMAKALLRLNDKPHRENRAKNHFYKTKKHKNFPNTMMDYYKIQNGLEGNSIYTHFYVRSFDNKLIISSFKELEL